MSTDIAKMWSSMMSASDDIVNWRDPAFTEEEFLHARDGFEGFFPKEYSEIYSKDLMQTMLQDLAGSIDDLSGNLVGISDHRTINNPFNISDIEIMSQDEIDEALAPVLTQTIQHPDNPRILLADFNGAAIAIRHSSVDAIIVKDSPKPHDMVAESCEGQEIEILIHDTIRSVLQQNFKGATDDDVLNVELQRLSFRTILQGIDNFDRFPIGENVRNEIKHLQNLFKYATGKGASHQEAIVQATGPKVENPLQGEWHFDRETIEDEGMIRAIVEGRVLPEQKYLAIKTARGQDTQFTAEVRPRNEIVGWEMGKTDHDAVAKEINAEDVIYNGVLFAKVSMAGEVLAQIQKHNDFIHRSPSVLKGFGRMAYALGG